MNRLAIEIAVACAAFTGGIIAAWTISPTPPARVLEQLEMLGVAPAPAAVEEQESFGQSIGRQIRNDAANGRLAQRDDDC